MTKKHLIIDAIVAINPNAQVTVLNNNYEEIIWGNTPLISKEVINEKIIQLDENYISEKQAKIDTKASVLAKLSALGLTEKEVQAIIK